MTKRNPTSVKKLIMNEIASFQPKKQNDQIFQSH